MTAKKNDGEVKAQRIMLNYDELFALWEYAAANREGLEGTCKTGPEHAKDVSDALGFPVSVEALKKSCKRRHFTLNTKRLRAPSSGKKHQHRDDVRERQGRLEVFAGRGFVGLRELVLNLYRRLEEPIPDDLLALLPEVPSRFLKKTGDGQ